ncbi:MAG TPA: hypothetical protein VND19_09035 [Acetobacteraceae bacterium]|nr:hypothetical protein [Acetobacteraceae bacterium]
MSDRQACRPRPGRGMGPAGASLALGLLLLATCAGPGPRPGSAEAREHAETVAACRQRADEMYNIRHRDAIYAGPSQVNTPFSADDTANTPGRGLSQMYERDSMVTDCVRNTGAEGDRTPEQGALPPPAPAARP